MQATDDSINDLFATPAEGPAALEAAAPGSVLDPAVSAQLSQGDVDPPAFAPAPGTGGTGPINILAGRAAASASAAALAATTAYNNIGMAQQGSLPLKEHRKAC